MANTIDEEIIPMYLDKFFKMIFADKNDLKYLKYLISVILNIKIKNITIISPELPGNLLTTKSSYLDILVELDDLSKINIEINSNSKSYVFDRNLFFLFKVMGNDLKIGEDYKKLNKYIQINLNANINQKVSMMKYKLINIETKEVLTDKLEIINIDVEKLSDKCYNEGIKKQDDFTKLMGLIGSKDKKHYDIFKGETGIMEELIGKADKIRYDNNLLQVLDYEKMRDNREIAAREEGFNDGIKETAKNMLNKKLDIEVISEVTGLSKEEIEKLN